jgi:hypothetical protein
MTALDAPNQLNGNRLYGVPSTELRVGGPAHVESGTTPRERAVLSFFVLWVGLGLAIDTRKHNTEESIDTFFTSAHGLLYAGWFACAVFILYVVRQRMAAGANAFAAVPEGLKGAAAGAVLFGVSGLLDMGWHITWGVEQNLAILFSPTHLSLMTSFFLLAFGPVRALWMDANDSVKRLTLINMGPAALSVGVLGVIFSVFLSFNMPFTPTGDGGIFTTTLPLPIPELATLVTVSQISGLLLYTVAVIGSALLLLRRWDAPFGSMTVVFGVNALCTLISVDFAFKSLMLSMVVSGLTMDVVWFCLRRLPNRRIAFRMFGLLTPLSLWGSYLAFTVVGSRIQWERELWTGTVVWSAIIGLGISAILLPPRKTPKSYLD